MSPVGPKRARARRWIGEQESFGFFNRTSRAITGTGGARLAYPRTIERDPAAGCRHARHSRHGDEVGAEQSGMKMVSIVTARL